MHTSESPLAKLTVSLSNAATSIYDPYTHEVVELAGQDFRVIDWWDRVNGDNYHNLAVEYAARSGHTVEGSEVLYGKVGNRHVLVNVTEIEDI